MTKSGTSQPVNLARARSAAYALVAYGYRYPDRVLIDELADPNRWSSWPAVLRDYDSQVAKALDEFRTRLAVVLENLGDDPTAVPVELQKDFNRLFGHAVRGKCPPYELEYGRGEIIQKASGLADIAGFYAAFGMNVSPSAEDRVDHVSVETEFLSLLCAKEAHALAESHGEHRDVSVQAQRTFLRDHFAQWFPAFAHRVQQVDRSGFYGALSRFALSVVAADCRRMTLAVGPETLALTPVDEKLDRTISCGPPECGPDGRPEEFVRLNIEST